METFTLSRKELHRPGLLKAVGAGRITNGQAAAALRLSVRQVQRLKGRFQAGGPRPAAWQSRAAVASTAGRCRARADRPLNEDGVRGLQRHAPDGETP